MEDDLETNTGRQARQCVLMAIKALPLPTDKVSYAKFPESSGLVPSDHICISQALNIAMGEDRGEIQAGLFTQHKGRKKRLWLRSLTEGAEL